MKVLIACEFSGTVRDAFIKAGHQAISIDLLPSEGIYRDFHIQGDIKEIIADGRLGVHLVDLMIAHPPCTDLAVSGAAHFAAKIADGRQQAALDFVQYLMDLPIPKIAIENPISVISSKIRQPEQIIQPWAFGEDASKATCLWLKNLPSLLPTKYIAPTLGGGGRPVWSNQTASGQNKLTPSKDRWKLRSITYQGIADAMAEQWGVA